MRVLPEKENLTGKVPSPADRRDPLDDAVDNVPAGGIGLRSLG
jgi:hypothetical protein